MESALVSWAFGEAERYLEALPRRWQHSLGVWRQAQLLRAVVGSDDELLEAAALLHDIGYAPGLVETGFHPVDGARFLRAAGVDEVVVSLVAHHSCADLEALERGLSADLAEFPAGDALLTDALIYCDMTSSPDGEVVAPEERIAEIRTRYGDDSPVGRFIQVADPSLRAAADRVARLLEASGSPATSEHR